MTIQALFFDRDDTIIKNIPYLGDPKLVQYLEGYFELIKFLNDNNIKYFMVTNQSGIGRNLITLEQMHSVNEKINRDLIEKDLKPFYEIAFCPHHPNDQCDCRKPQPKMILDLISKWKLNPNNCIMIGDRESDYLAGKNAGVQSLKLSNTSSESSISDLKSFQKYIQNLITAK